MGTRVEWTTGSDGLRPGLRAETRYTRPHGIHAGAAMIVTASPFVATMVMLCAALLTH